MVGTEPKVHETRVLELFAELLEYPHRGLARTARECSAAVASDNPEAVALLKQFAAFVERVPFNTLEEVYTATFDLNASRHLYIGYHLFGEAYKRSVFMLELKNRYRAHGFNEGLELTDHLAIMLRFMAGCPEKSVVEEIALEAVIPSLDPMIVCDEAEPVVEGEEQPPFFDIGDDYSRVLKALRLVLLARFGEPAQLEVIPLPDESRLVS